MFRSEPAANGAAAQFVADFSNALKQLTFNSRPIILALTDLARENRAYAREVIECLEAHIRSSPPNHKLPVLYVLDSICKNVGQEYITLAERNLFTTVTSVFDVVDDSTRSSILHLLRTWSDTSVFPPATVDRINIRLRNIMQKSGRFVQPQSSRDTMQPQIPQQGYHQLPMQPPGVIPMAPHVVQQGYAHLAQAGITNPAGVSPAAAAAVTATALAELDQSEVPILSRLYQLLTGAAAPPMMAPKDLLSQRATILGHVQAALAQNRLPSSEAVGLIQQLQQLHSIRAVLQQSAGAQQPPAPVAPPAGSLFAMPGRPAVPQPPQPAAPLSQLLGAGSNSLFQSLQSALQGSATAPVASQRPMHPMQPMQAMQHLQSNPKPISQTATVGQPDFRDPESLKKTYTNVVSSLYDDFKHRCSQCGLRFREKPKLDNHLDWHFQQKRKEKASAKKAFSRPWFIAAADWQQTHGGLVSLAGKQDAKTEKGKSDEESSSEEKPNTVPADENQANCAGCGEEFEQFYDGETEEWMFQNAMKGADGKIYHTQCYSPSTEEERMSRKRAHDEMTAASPADASVEDSSKRVRVE